VTPAPPPKKIDYDERVYRKGHPPHRVRNALILIALVLVGTYFAVTKSIPFKPEYELHAVFENAANIRKDSPVRIAGVNVGKVQSIRSVGNVSEVTFTVDDNGRPIHEDATVEIRPRIFLEGNFFLDVKSGSPSAPELDDDATIPITQTSTAVQLDQVLTTLQAPDRENLQKLLQGYGTALNHQPTAAEDKGMDQDIKGKSAAEAINQSFVYGATAARDSAIVQEALLGTQPHDFSDLISGQARLFGGLADRQEQLKDLVTNFNTTVGAFAAESDNLAETVRLLGPTVERAEPALRHTNQSFPFLRAFARDITPGIEELPDTIAVSQPWLSETKALLGPTELQPIARELRLTAPPAARAAAAGSALFSQTELLSRCVSQVLIPTGDIPIADMFGPNVPNYKEFMYAASHFAGETQTFDGNGPYLRFQSGGGSFGGPRNGLVSSPQPGGGPNNEILFGRTGFMPLGVQPLLGNKPPFRTDVPCHLNAIPDVNGPLAGPGPPNPSVVP
jgi:phospholipid/cholesterol/gamma-HCH transport system substrate-binding protein